MAVSGFQFESTASVSSSNSIFPGSSVNPSVQASVWTINGTNRSTLPDGSYLITNIGLIRGTCAFYLASGSASGDGNVQVSQSSTNPTTTSTVNPWNLTTTQTNHIVNYSNTAIIVTAQPMKALDGVYAEATWKNDSGATQTPHWNLSGDLVVDVYPMCIGLMMTA